MLLHKLGLTNQDRVYARKTTIKEIGALESESFLNANHIQGSSGAATQLGMFFENHLVSVLSIRKEDKGKTGNIVRYATSKHVIGGFTKLLKHVENSYNFEKVITFSDNCVSDGELYRNNGFEKTYELPPDYMYVIKGDHREHKFGYRKARFRDDAGLLYEEDMTERQLAKLNNLRRIYDAGKIKWVKVLENFS